MTRAPFRGRHPLRARGLTLLEMLVAVAIFALASALAYGGLDGLMRARGQLDATQERLGRVQFALGLLERDVRSVAPRSIRDGYGAKHDAIEGASDRVEVTRGGLANALERPRAELERIGWRVIDGTLQRRRWPVLDRAPGTQPIDDDLLDGVQSLRFQYVDAQGREVPQWPPPQGSTGTMPRALIVTLEFADLGEIRRVLELPSEVAQ
jgi:general secretion pathway protein J